ncbi:MAG: response regulator [Deltaproteobacteria bacterium]|nr:response regulator [Deltaproteobacteria bacterium]
MSLKKRWIIVITVGILHPILLYTLFPIFGVTVNALSFVLPVLATLLLGLRVGLVSTIPIILFTAGVFDIISPMPPEEYLPKSFLSVGINAVLCIGVNWAKKTFFMKKKAQSDLEDTEEQYRLIFENSAQGIICIDNNGIITEANPLTSTLLGIPSSKLIGKPIAEVEILPTHFTAQLAELMASEDAVLRTDITIHVQTTNKSSRTMDTSVSNIHQQGKSTRWILMFKDTTEQRKMEAQLQESKRMESIGRLTGGIAHDMNNILNAVMSASYALRQNVAARGAVAADLETIDRACDQGAQLTRSLLGFARKQTQTSEIFSINEIIESVLAIIHRTSPKSINIVTSLDPEPIVMEGDPAEIESAVMNLCINALDAMGERGTLEIKTDRLNGHFSLAITDTGVGIDASIRDLVFEPFFTTKPIGEGTGLGLAMVYGAVQKHNGTISVESTPGVGTSMTITFNRYNGPIDIPNDLEERTYKSMKTPLTKMTVLLVDDDPIVLRASERLLSVLGATVISADSGKKAIQLYAQNALEIDLFMFDLAMPEMDGAHLLKTIREMQCMIPAVLVSGFTAEPTRLEELKTKLPRFEFLHKPFKPHELLQTIDCLGALSKSGKQTQDRLTLLRS